LFNGETGSGISGKGKKFKKGKFKLKFRPTNTTCNICEEKEH